MSEPRVMVIGLDGVTFDLLGPMMDRGVMPFLAGLRQSGAHGRLTSTTPPVTAPAWASFMTGVNPGRHGIYEFTHRRRGELTHTPVNGSSLRMPTLWQRLSAAGKRVAVINVPITYPPAPVNGILISGLETPAGARDFTFPPALLDELESELGPYPLHHRQVYARGKVPAVLDEALALLDYRQRTALHLLKQGGWDFFMVYYHGTDRIQHELWHVLDDKHPAHDRGEAAAHRERVVAFFGAVDDFVRKVAERALPNTTLIVMSDHGFGPIHKFVNFNAWLLQEGFLKLKADLTTRLKYLAFRLGFTPALGYRIAMRLGFAHLRLAAGMTKRASLLSLLEKAFLSFENVDWERTTAYSRGNYGQIFVNLKDREPNGSVPPDLFETVRDDLSARLTVMTDPNTHERIIDRVLRGEEIYRGDQVGEAPDLLPVTRDMRYKPLGTVSFTSQRVVEPVFGNSGDHRMEGVLFMRGDGVEPGKVIEDGQIIDLAPTILHLLDQPIPTSLDGVVLSQAFTPEFVAAHPLTTVAEQAGAASAPQSAAYTPAEEAEVIEQLRRLGYEA